MEVHYTSSYVQAIGVVTSEGSYTGFGSATSSTLKKSLSFDAEHELIGTYGMNSDNGIIAIGLVVYDGLDCRNREDETPTEPTEPAEPTEPVEPT